MTSSLQQAKAYAWRRLATKGQPTVELINAMKKKGFAEEDIAPVIEECRTLGYLDDGQWIESFIKRELGRNRSLKIIAQKLRLKGIERSLIEHHLNQFATSDINALKSLVLQKYHRYDLKDPKQKQKLFAALIRRGFDYQTIASFMNFPDEKF